jgi:hypothetical protein
MLSGGILEDEIPNIWEHNCNSHIEKLMSYSLLTKKEVEDEK